MDLLQNPFYLLTTTQQDDLRKIMEISEKQVLLLDPDECMVARAELTNPRKRLGAELAWMPGIDPERVYDILMLLEASAGNHRNRDKLTSIMLAGSLASTLSHLPNVQTYNIGDKILDLLLKGSEEGFTEVEKFLGIDRVTPIARANLLAARIVRLPDYTPEDTAKWIRTIAEVFEAINPEAVRATLNADRKLSGFPEITDLSTIETEIQKRRLYYQKVIKSVLENIPSPKVRVRAVMMAVELATDSDVKGWPILIEDMVDSYEEGAVTFLETENSKLETLNRDLRIAAEESDSTFALIVDELIQNLRDWGLIAQPIQLKKNRQGLRHDPSHDITSSVRQLAIHLFNEYDKLEFSRQILNALREIFTAVPEVVERTTADLEALNKIAKQRKQKTF